MSVARAIRERNRQYGPRLGPIPERDWPPMRPQFGTYPVEVWRSCDFLVMVYREDSGHERLSVLRTELALNGRYAEHIRWDDLQRLKAECGRGDRWAVEVYPPEEHLINVQNMRHLFLLHGAPDYGWRKGHADG